MLTHQNKQLLGIVSKPHGTKADFIVRSDNEIPEAAFSREFIFVEINGGLVPFRIIQIEDFDKTSVKVRTKFIESIEDIKKYASFKVYIDAEDIETTPVETLSGFSIFDSNTSRSIGKITNMAGNDLNPLFELENGILIPANEDLISDINYEKKILTMNLPEGILDIG